MKRPQIQITDEELLAFEGDVLHASIMQVVSAHMGDLKATELAKKIGVSDSFISQLFSGDKRVNMDLMAKFQRALNFKFEIKGVSSLENNVNRPEDHIKGTARTR